MTLHDWEQYHLTDDERQQLREQRAIHHAAIRCTSYTKAWPHVRCIHVEGHSFDTTSHESGPTAWGRQYRWKDEDGTARDMGTLEAVTKAEQDRESRLAATRAALEAWTQLESYYPQDDA